MGTRQGARSIGIGHPRSGDRCVATHPYHLDPLRVAEQTSLPSATRKGSCRFSQSLYIGLRHYVARPMPRERASFGCRYYCQSLVYLGKTSDLSDSSDLSVL